MGRLAHGLQDHQPCSGQVIAPIRKALPIHPVKKMEGCLPVGYGIAGAVRPHLPKESGRTGICRYSLPKRQNFFCRKGLPVLPTNRHKNGRKLHYFTERVGRGRPPRPFTQNGHDIGTYNSREHGSGGSPYGLSLGISRRIHRKRGGLFDDTLHAKRIAP